jgi:hypothetical protein
MAALPAVPKVVRIDNHFSQNNTANLQFRNFFQYGGTLSQSDANTWCATIQAALITFLHTYAVTSLVNTLTELTDLTSNTAPQTLNATGGAGTNVNPPNAAGVAVIMKHKLTTRYRGGHPKVYIPGTSQTALATATQWDATHLGIIAAGYIAYINACVAGVPAAASPATHVSISYFSGFENVTSGSGRCHPRPQPRVTPVVHAIVDLIANTSPASQRRRNTTP